MIRKIKKLLGLEKLHPDVQFFLDSENLKIGLPASFIVMIVELSFFLNTIIYAIKSYGNKASQFYLQLLSIEKIDERKVNIKSNNISDFIKQLIDW